MKAVLKKLVHGFLIPSKVLLRSRPQAEKSLFLTFDDGPNLGITDQLLDLLAQHQCQASFFIIGRRAEKEHALVQRIVAEGHTIANHSYSHPDFHQISLAQQKQEISQTNQLLQQQTGEVCRWFRAPQGKWNMRLLWHLFKHKIIAAHWSRDSLDYQKKPAAQLIENFYRQPVSGGDIILFHDDNNLCIEILQVLIPHWQKQGFTLKALTN